MHILYLLFMLAKLSYCEEMYVEVSVLVSGDYNVSDLYDNLYHPNASKLSNSTGNVTNTSHLNNHTQIPIPIIPIIIPFIKNSVYRILSVSPLLCVIGYDFNCFNDTNVTRLLDNTAIKSTTEPLPVGFIVGTCTALVVVVILGILFKTGFRKKTVPLPEKRLVMPILIDWPPRNKKPSPGNGMPIVVVNQYPHSHA